MKNKKIIIMYVTAFIIILLIGVWAIKYVKNKKAENGALVDNEYTPQEEITDEQFRQTIVSLYFVNKETGNVEPEARLVDIRDIMNIPYDRILNLLLEGPRSDKLQSIIPNGTKVNKTFIEKDCLTIDFSAEFASMEKNQKEKIIKAIVNTMTELTEINSVKILIDGNENSDFAEVYTRAK